MRPVTSHRFSLCLCCSLPGPARPRHPQGRRARTFRRLRHLEAAIAANHGDCDKDERSLDTERIQHAIDNCAGPPRTGLRPWGRKLSCCAPMAGNDVFLTAPRPAPRRHPGSGREYRAGCFARSASLRSGSRQLRHRERTRPRMQAVIAGSGAQDSGIMAWAPSTAVARQLLARM